MGNGESFSMYTVSEVRYQHDMSTVSQWVEINILLTRRFESYLLTTFVPCIILVILGQVTLTHFGLDDFQDRITVTLSLLIVVASLFSQVVSGLPNSPVPKIVEIFFFYCVLRLAYVFVQHSLVESHLRRKKNTAEDKVLELNKKIFAWIADDKVEEKDPKPKQPFLIKIFNHFGLIIGLVLDIIVVTSIVYVIWCDAKSKENWFLSLNRTETQ